MLSHGINAINISTLSPDFPAHSDHLGIVLDIDLAAYFSSTYSDMCSAPPRMLTSDNRWSVEAYTKYVMEQVKIHQLEDRLNILLDKASHLNNTSFSMDDIISLNLIDEQLTNIMPAGERKCSRKPNQWQFWSPHQREIARTFSYWNKKSIMESRKLINWEHLNNLHTHTSITEVEYASIDPALIST